MIEIANNHTLLKIDQLIKQEYRTRVVRLSTGEIKSEEIDKFDLSHTRNRVYDRLCETDFVGINGTGLTTLLRSIALDIVSKRKSSYNHVFHNERNIVPLYIDFDYISNGLEIKDDFFFLLKKSFVYSKITPELFDVLVDNKQILLLCDNVSIHHKKMEYIIDLVKTKGVKMVIGKDENVSTFDDTGLVLSLS